ncbi:MAG: sulfate ABC transporter substrate-binding protein [Rudaea sp.]
MHERAANRPNKWNPLRAWLAIVALPLVACAGGSSSARAASLLNVSYDVARGLYEELNPAFVEEWKRKTGETVDIDQSHGGSTKQAHAVIEGLPADVVTMNSPLDIDAIADAGLLPNDWATHFPAAASPSWSVIVFVVRKGNPKALRDWSELVKPGVQVILPNPKTSGNGRYSYLAAWQFARMQPGADAAAPLAFEKKLLANVPILDIGGRDATTTFAQRGIGDALLTFESEAKVVVATFGADKFEIAYPSLSVRANNPVAVVAKNADRKGSAQLAQAYLQFHYGKVAQEIFARRGMRVVDAGVAAAHAAEFPLIRTFVVDAAFGGWAKAQAEHFATGGTFDKVTAEVKR